MKKIFYSLMAVTLCACAQSDVEDVVTPPQVEDNNLKFTVVDNGFLNENGTRVAYGEGTAATFEEGDVIGIFAIKSAGTEGTTYTTATPYTPTDDAYTVSNAKLTLTNGTWVLTDAEGNANVDFGDADLLLAYRPYRADAKIPAWTSGDYAEGRPSFIGAKGSWDINTVDNRFFVHPYNENWDTSTIEKFENADWMGDAASVDSNTKEVTFNMIHMRGMIELTTDKNVELIEMKVGFGKDAAGNTFKPYFVNENDANRTQNVYRTLTTEYRNALTIYATIQDVNIVKKYKKVIDEADYKKAGVRYRVNIAYKPVPTVTVGDGTSLADALAGMNPTPTTLRLKGTLSEDDFTTLKNLTALTTLDMSALTNTSLVDSWLAGAPVIETLTTLVLPSELETIDHNALQVTKVTHIDIPATVKTIAIGAFWGRGQLSVCIPEDSQLQTIGDGAFNYVKAVYTDPNNENVLKMPASVTSIENNAFANISTMEKLIFQSTEAPTIGGANTFGGTNKATIYVPNSANYKGKGLFPGHTVIVGPTLTADNYSSPYTVTYDGDGLPALCDGDINTYWHTAWQAPKSGDATYGQYIDITLPEGVTMSSLMIQYGTRKQNNNAVPEIIDVYTSTDGNWGNPLFTLTKDVNTLPTGAGETYTSEKYTASAPFTKIRFAITQSALGSLTAGENSESTSLSELSIYEDKWTE